MLWAESGAPPEASGDSATAPLRALGLLDLGCFGQKSAGAANRTRTCDPVITNDVLYQLSYCGGPCGRVWKRPDASPLISGTARFGKKNGLPPGAASIAPAGQEPAPAAGLALRGADLFREFIVHGFVVDAGIVGRPDDGNHRRDAG